jgi:hypothetical protein
VVLAREPVPGRAKTRLVPVLGAEGAARLHERLVRHALATVTAAAVGPVELCVTPDAHHPVLARCADDADVDLALQGEGDLGDRMLAAFRRRAPAILIGSDCPALEVRHLVAARDALANGVEVVIAPAEDGGYALIGLARPVPELFRGVPWGGDGVMAATRLALAQHAVVHRELETLWDVDRPEDLERVRRTHPDLLADQ